MAITEQNRLLEVRACQISCDLCGKLEHEDLSVIQISPSTVWGVVGAACDRNIPPDLAKFEKLMLERGWTAESWHGKVYILCPECAAR